MADLPDELFERVVAFRRLLSTHMRGNLAVLQEWDLSLVQALAVFHLGDEGPTNIGGLQEVVGRSQPATSHLVDQLASRDLVARRQSKQDRRRSEVYLTRRGRRIVAQLERTRRRGLEQALNEVPVDLTRRLNDVLGALLDVAAPRD